MNRKTLARSRFHRTSAEGGGGGGGNTTTATATGDQQQTTATNTTNQQQTAGPVEATDETGAGLGFPKDTPTEQMTDGQRANYWRHQSKVQQKKVPANLDQIQKDAQAWAEYQRTQKPAEEQERDRIRAEVEAETTKKIGADSAVALLKDVLQNRGKTEAEVNGLVEFVDGARFLTSEGKMDTAKVTTFANTLVPAGQAGGGGFGQGRYQQTGTSKRELGAAEAAKRFGNQQQDPQRGSLGGLRR
jgi:hypothetical protein